jgi:hypothetical protein
MNICGTYTPAGEALFAFVLAIACTAVITWLLVRMFRVWGLLIAFAVFGGGGALWLQYLLTAHNC